MTPTAAVRVEEIGDAVLLALARPEHRNAIDQQMVTELHEACSRLEADPRVALIIGDGESFAAGADIAELSAHPLIDDLAQAILFETDETRDRMTTFLNRKNPD